MSILILKNRLVSSSIPKLALHLTLCFFLMHASRAFGQDTGTFYVDNGRGVSKVENGDSTQIKVTEWQVRLYKKGQSTGGNDQWGLITGKSAQSVMEKLKKAQDFELRYNAWAGKGRVPDDVFTHFNPLGPIAVVEREPTEREQALDKKRLIPKEIWDRIQNAYERAKGYYEGYQRIGEITSKEPKLKTPFDNVGDVFREYTDNLREAFERVADLRRRLEGITTPSIDEINRAIDEINRSLDAARNNASRVSSGLGIKEEEIILPNTTPKPDGQSVSGDTPSGKNNSEIDRKLEELAKQLESAFENIDPNNPEAVFQRVNSIARQMLNLVEKSPDSDANMKELARLLLSITETTDPEALSNKLERLTELLERIKP
jgi:methyl-accepting chemotaxis protein